MEKNNLTIEIDHPSPEDFLKDLKKSIIEVMQNQSGKGHDLKTVHFINYTLLELLKSLELSEVPETPRLKKERKRKSSQGPSSIITSIRPDLP